jgi:hypothetical protein
VLNNFETNWFHCKVQSWKDQGTANLFLGQISNLLFYPAPAFPKKILQFPTHPSSRKFATLIRAASPNNPSRLPNIAAFFSSSSSPTQPQLPRDLPSHGGDPGHVARRHHQEQQEEQLLVRRWRPPPGRIWLCWRRGRRADQAPIQEVGEQAGAIPTAQGTNESSGLEMLCVAPAEDAGLPVLVEVEAGGEVVGRFFSLWCDAILRPQTRRGSTACTPRSPLGEEPEAAAGGSRLSRRAPSSTSPTSTSAYPTTTSRYKASPDQHRLLLLPSS